MAHSTSSVQARSTVSAQESDDDSGGGEIGDEHRNGPGRKWGAGLRGEVTRFVGQVYEESGQGSVLSGRKKTRRIFLGSTLIAVVASHGSRATSDVTFYHTNHLGSTNITTDENGELKEWIEHEPFGKIVVHEKYGSDPDTANWYFYAGHRYDDESGLIYMGARYYNPAIGRFLTADTIVQSPGGNPQTFNRYSYANNNPVNNIDPSGHGWFKKFFGKILGFVAGVITTIATGGNFYAGFQVYSLVDSVASSAQALAAGASPGKIFGALGASIGLSIIGGGLGIGDIADLGLRMGAFAVQGAAIGASTSAIMGTSIGEGAAWGAGFGAVTGFLSSQQYQNWTEGNGFQSNAEFARQQNTVSNYYDQLAASGQPGFESGPVGEFTLAANDGHAGIGVTGLKDNQLFGKYPLRGAGGSSGEATWIFGRRSAGNIRVEGQYNSPSFINVPPATRGWQINRLQQYMLQDYVAKGGQTFTLSTNCSDWALGAARTIGINTPNNMSTMGFTNPAKIQDWLNN